MDFIKPKKLKIGDTIAIVTPSWGGPEKFPYVYEKGISTIRKLGFKIKEFPSVKKDNNFLYNNPEFRAKDINEAFKDKDVKAIIATIGGDESIRILPFLDKEIILNNPKMLMGYSDITTLTAYLNKLGLVTFNGQTIMSGFAQFEEFEEKFKTYFEKFIFGDIKGIEYPTFSRYSNEYENWQDKDKIGKLKETFLNDGWYLLQGNGKITGKLFGGCIEVLEFMKGTHFWPEKNFWNDKILFFETSEEKPSIEQIKRILRNYGIQGIFNKISGLLFGRARDYTNDEKKELDEAIIQIIKNEFGNNKISIISNMDFGHTEPQFILPLGIEAEINCDKKTFKLIENPFL